MKACCMKKITVAFLCTLICISAYAQKVYQGEVTGAKNIEPISGVSILIKGTSSGTLTDSSGAFRIRAKKHYLFPIPINEILNNSAIDLTDQNPGY